MNALWQSFWQQRSPQEQRTLILAAIALILMLGYQLLWAPLHQAAKTADARLQETQALADFTAQAKQSLTSNQSRPQVTPPLAMDAPLVWLSQQATSAGLSDALKSQQITPDGIELQFDGVSFDALLRWLSQTEAAGFRVVRSDMRPQGAGLAHITLTLAAPTAP